MDRYSKSSSWVIVLLGNVAYVIELLLVIFNLR
jgi:hypothetical protein